MYSCLYQVQDVCTCGTGSDFIVGQEVILLCILVYCRWITSKSNVLEWLLEVVKVRRKLEGKHENDVVMFE